MKIQEALQSAYKAKASDIHLAPGRPLMCRIDGAIRPYSDDAISKEDLEEWLSDLLSDMQFEQLRQDGWLDAAVSVSDVFRMRLHLGRRQGGYVAAVRMLPKAIPPINEIGLPASAMRFMEERGGLVFIAGEAGSGKTTTAYALLNQIAQNQARHIVTVEDTVGYWLPHGKGLASQLEVDGDGMGYAAALRRLTRWDTDILFVGAMEDADTLREAISAAEAGCLAFVSVCACGCGAVLGRLLEFLPDTDGGLARARFAGVLNGVVSQQLLPYPDRAGRSAVFEVMMATPEIRTLIQEGKIAQILSFMEGKGELGMQTMDDAILSAYMQSRISAETAAAFALDQTRMKQRMRIY